MNPTATLTLDRDSLRLSDTLRATLTVEGPAPLVVETAKEVLGDDTAAGWAVASASPGAMTVLPGGRERWERTFTLSPFLPGDGQAVQFAPLTVNGRVVEVPAAVASVRTSIASATAADARPVTGPESLPVPMGSGFDWLEAVPAVSVGAVIMLTLAAWLARRRRAVTLSPREWVTGELDSLDRQSAAGEDPAVTCDRLAAVLRVYVERRTGVPAGRMTTGELLGHELIGAAVEPLRPVFEWCDLAKFAGRTPTADEGRELIGRARGAI